MTILPSAKENPLGPYSNEVVKSLPLSREREGALARRIQNGDLEARNELVQANLRFVIDVAKSYQNRGLQLADLISAGNVGLITAAERFDGDKGHKFITYAVWWIRQAINQALADNSRTVRIPLNRLSLLRNINKATRHLTQQGAQHPSYEELARELDVAPEDIRDTLLSNQSTLSLEDPLDEDGRCLIDFLADENQAAPDDSLLNASAKEAIGNALGSLDEREQYILRLYFGFGDTEPLYLEEIGTLMNLTRERIRQLKERALNKLRHHTNNSALRSLVEEA